MSNLMNNTDKRNTNNWSKKFKNITINSISNKLKTNNAIIVLAVKLNAIVLTYKDNIHDKTSKFINNNIGL